MTPLSGARVLVTGASGLIGSHVLRLVEDDVDVIALSRIARPNEPAIRWLACDLERPGAVAETVTSVSPDVVIHLAGAVRGDRSLDAVGPTLRTNLVAGVELLEAATRVGCRRIVLSGSLLEEPAAGGPTAVPPSSKVALLRNQVTGEADAELVQNTKGAARTIALNTMPAIALVSLFIIRSP